jgi:uncharacterized membrane protein YraQ (UPF0718 family)
MPDLPAVSNLFFIKLVRSFLNLSLHYNTVLLFMESLYHNFLNHYLGSHTKLILDESIVLLAKLWPYLVSGITITSLVRIFLSKETITRFFLSGKHFSIIGAALIGVISPLGSYIVIPLSAALYISGVPLPVLMALLVSSPLIDPNLFLLTSGAFGFRLAIARLVSAFLLGITAGYTSRWLIFQKKLKTENILKMTESSSPLKLSDISVKPTFKIFLKELWGMSRFIGKYFFLAIILAAVIKIITPPNLMLRLFGTNEFLSVVFSTGAGIPFYVCGGAAIPVVQQLAGLGMSQGAVLAFFISGPVTKVSNLVLMQAIFRYRVLMIYLLTGIVGAAILGLIYSLF